MRKWGPSIRSIVNTLAIPGFEGVLHDDVIAETTQLLNEPSHAFEGPGGASRLPMGIASHVLFIRPNRDQTPKLSGRSICFIPTDYISYVFQKHREEVFTDTSVNTSLKLVEAFSSHSFTRSAAGWAHECNMHSYLARDNVALEIFNDRGDKALMLPAGCRLVPGTLAGIKEPGASESFYWIPSATNHPGIDGVLGYTDGCLYAVQATIATEHASPKEGLKRLYSDLSPHNRTRTWRFVMVVDRQATAASFLKKLPDFNIQIGQVSVPVQVWACILR